MAWTSRVVHSDADILGGTPVFVGTRVDDRAVTAWALLGSCD